MIVYWLLMLPAAAIAYLVGSMSTLVLASNFLFRYNLLRLGHGNDWLSNFRRVYGIKGALVLLLVEAIKDILPILIGSALLGIKGHGDAGRAFAGFCLVVGRLWPIYYDLKGSYAIMPMIFSAMFADTSLGIALVVLVIGTLWLTRYLPLAAMAGGLAMIAASFLIMENRLCIYLVVLTGLAVVIHSLPALKRISEGREIKYTLREDLTYKLDNHF